MDEYLNFEPLQKLKTNCQIMSCSYFNSFWFYGRNYFRRFADTIPFQEWTIQLKHIFWFLCLRTECWNISKHSSSYSILYFCARRRVFVFLFQFTFLPFYLRDFAPPVFLLVVSCSSFYSHNIDVVFRMLVNFMLLIVRVWMKGR